MKKINLILGALVCMFAFSACTEEVEYTPALPEAVKGVYFPETSATIQLVAGQTSFDVNVCRVNAAEAQDVVINVTSTDSVGVLTVPNQVSFNAGDSVATLTIACDLLKKSPSATLNYQLAIDGASTYEMGSMALTVKLPEWTSLGYAEYTEDIMASLFSIQNLTYQVEVLQHNEETGRYRLVNPYGEVYPYNVPGDWDASKDYYLEINASDPQGVYIEEQALGLDWGYGMTYVYSMAANYMAGGYSLEEIKAAGYCGTLENGVITFPAKTLLVTMESESGWYYANTHGAFEVVLPSAQKTAKSVKSVINKQGADKKSFLGEKFVK